MPVKQEHRIIINAQIIKQQIKNVHKIYIIQEIIQQIKQIHKIFNKHRIIQQVKQMHKVHII